LKLDANEAKAEVEKKKEHAKGNWKTESFT
jgi:hypothetical protein